MITGARVSFGGELVRREYKFVERTGILHLPLLSETLTITWRSGTPATTHTLKPGVNHGQPRSQMGYPNSTLILCCSLAIRHPQNLAQNIGFQLSKFSKITHEQCGEDVDCNCQALHPYCMPFQLPTLALCWCAGSAWLTIRYRCSKVLSESARSPPGRCVH